MKNNEVINKLLKKQKENLLKALANVKEARDNAPGAMESHHDTTRNQSEKLISVLEQQLDDLEDTVNKISTNNKTFPVIEVGINGEKKKFMLVTEGLGGEQIDGIRLLSENSPLGLELKGKRTGDKFNFNGQQVVIFS